MLAREARDEGIRALDEGADDYLERPFSLLASSTRGYVR
jgi:DNA-binding response OmpR family regulator